MMPTVHTPTNVNTNLFPNLLLVWRRRLSLPLFFQVRNFFFKNSFDIEPKKMASFLRRKVSLNKKRFQEDGFDLDLSCIPELEQHISFKHRYKLSINCNGVPSCWLGEYFSKSSEGSQKIFGSSSC
jgi:hypothetical protein